VAAKPVVLATGRGSPAVTATASVWLWTIPWPLVILLIVVIAAVYLYRRKRSRRPPNEAGGEISRSDEVLESVGRAEVPA
jgi:membrane protein implicated in regulation of membrane protease activity